MLVKDQPLWTLLANNFDNGINARRNAERRWLISLAFLAGRQYVFFNENVHMLQQLTRQRGTVRTVDNQLIKRWSRLVADLIKTDPIMSVIPATTNDEDLAAARMGDKVLKSWWQSQKMRKKIRVLAGWIYSTGNGFLYDRWNPKIGPTEIAGEGPNEGKLIYAGDAEVGVRSPFEVVVPTSQFGSNELHDMPWMIEVSYMALEDITRNWESGHLVKAESYPTNQVDLNGILGNIGGHTQTAFKGAFVKRMSMKPCEDFPKGLYLVAANGVVLEQGEYSFLHYHLEHFKDIDIPGMFWATSKVEQGIGLQKTWNRIVSSVDEFNRVCAKGKMLVPRGANLEADPDDTNGQTLYYTPVLGRSPEWMNPPQMSQTAVLGLEATDKSLQDLFSQHEVTEGTNRSDIRSGLMVGLLREQDAHGAIPTHAVFEEGLEAVMGRVLKRIQAGYASERMLKVRGDEGDWEIVPFKGADLNNNTDVMVKRDSSLPDSRTAREAQVFERYQAGLYGDPADPKVRLKISRMLDDGTADDVYDMMKLDQKYARWENQMLLQSDGTDYLVNLYDDHGIHIEEHTAFMKSLAFQKIKGDNPSLFQQLNQIFEEHLNKHRGFFAEQRQAELEQVAKAQALAKGGE